MEHSSPPQRAASLNDPINNPAFNPAPPLVSNPHPDPDSSPNPAATSNSKPPPSPTTTTPNPTAIPDSPPNMALATLPSYFNYNLNILCGPYPNPFFVHIFLGEIPHLIDYQDPYSIPSWVGQDAIYPNPVQPPPQAAAAHPPPPGSTHAISSPHTHELSDNSASGPAPEPMPERRPSPPPVARPLPPSYTKGAVRSSQPLTTAIVARLHVRSAAELSPTTVARYLQLNLQWRLVGIGIPDRKRISVQQVPIRLWVVRQNVTPPADDTQFPVYGPAEVVWEASRGKLGGLERGELPGVG